MRKKGFRKDTLASIFLEIAKPNQLGHSDWIYIEDLIEIDPAFKTSNGCSWGRDDGALREYRIERDKKGKDGKNGRGVQRIRLTGIQESAKEKQVPNRIGVAIRARRCVVLDVGSRIECDHKNGRYESLPEHLELNDFQALSKAANDAKRTHCNECKETDKRYYARNLGYRVGWISPDIDASSWKRWGCTGCYWHDPRNFNAEVGKK